MTPAAAPIDPASLSRAAARAAAAAETAKPAYHADDPPLVSRLFDDVLRWLADTLQALVNRTPGGVFGLAVVVLLIVAVVVVIRVRTGPLAGAARAGLDLGEPGRTAEQCRQAAVAAAAAGRWREALHEQLRAVALQAEQDGLLSARPGRTARELAREAGAAVPGAAGALARAADVFDAVWYGGRPAGPETLAVVAAADAALRARRTDVLTGGPRTAVPPS